MTLDITTSTEFTPGTNVKGDIAGANWTFLLPSLELERIVCLGALPETTLITLARVGQRVMIICQSLQESKIIREISKQRHLTNVFTVVATSPTWLSFASTSIDLVVITGKIPRRQINGNGSTLSRLQRLLKPEGLIYFELSQSSIYPFRSCNRPDLVTESDGLQIFWSTPLGREMQTAVPATDLKTINYFFRKRLYSPTINFSVVDHLERYCSQHPLFNCLTRRYSALLSPKAATHPAEQPPQYLLEIAKQAGVDISNHLWGLSARGKYNSRKVLFFLLNRHSTLPEYIVKITRDPDLNYRLENEHRALSMLHSNGIAGSEVLPQVVFFGYHGNLAILGQTIVEGDPFRQQTEATANCPYAHAAIDWLTQFSTSTANAVTTNSFQVAEILRKLFYQLTEIYQLTREHSTFLEKQITAIENTQESFPVVFQHGDPGVWNLLVTKSGQPIFLDWEAAEPRGIPLWDLFYFFRSYCILTARTRGTRNALSGFKQQFLATSPLNALVIESVRRYCERIKLPGQLIEPLFYTCWMHRALKEATRLPEDKLERGHYIKLLRLCIDERAIPSFQNLFLT